MDGRSWPQVLRDPAGERHLVQLYRDPAFLRDAVVAWAAPALGNGGGAVLIGTSTSTSAVLDQLRLQGLDTDALRRSGRLAVFDADATLEKLMREGRPDPTLTKAVVGDALRRARASVGPKGDIRAWGEMVNVLWRKGQRPAAHALETIWNDIIDEHGVSLLCSYAADNLSHDMHADGLKELCATHSYLIPEEDHLSFARALDVAFREVCPAEAQAVRDRITKRSPRTRMPEAEAVLVALHEAHPSLARRVLEATRIQMDQLAG